MVAARYRRSKLLFMTTKVYWRTALLLALALVAASCRKSEPKETEVQVQTVGFDRSSQSPVVVLHDAAHDRALPIWIGVTEAQAIAVQIEGVKSPRPLTHDLVKTILDQSGVELQKVLISELRDNTYYARIFLSGGHGDIDVDCRPSDAIA